MWPNPVEASQKQCLRADCLNQGNDATLVKCPICYTAIYCSGLYQQEDWARHKVVCMPNVSQQKEKTTTASAIMGVEEESLLYPQDHNRIMKAIEDGKVRLDAISKKLGSSEARLEGERILMEAQECQSEMFDPDWSKLVESNLQISFPRIIDDGFKKLDSLKEDVARLVEEYSKKNPPSLDHLSDKEKEDLLFSTINENMSQLEQVSDEILFLISNGCGMSGEKLSKRIEQEVNLIEDFDLRFAINRVVTRKADLFR